MLSRFLRSPWPWLAGAGVLVAYYLLQGGLVPHTGSSAQDRRPVGGAEDIVALAERDDVNVLFILIDTLRADRLSTYGYNRRTSPVLDLLADSGVRFARNLAQSSWTKCSMASMWTGLNPVRAGVTRYDDVVPEAARLPAEILRDAGFRTAGLFRNGWVEGYFGFSQGFETYMRPPFQPLPPSVRLENPTLQNRGSDDEAVDAALEFLRIHGKERWFVYMHLMDVHEYLYDEETAIFGTTYSDVYDSSILRVNHILARFLVRLREQGYDQNTLIVISSDHGEAFLERGYEGHARHVHKESTEVPLILSFPFRLEEPAVVATRTSNVDVWPTILDLLGLPPLEPSDGRSRVPEILAAVRGERPAEPAETAIAHLDQNWGQRDVAARPTVAVTDAHLRYVMYRDEHGNQREHLYDRRRDWGELEDLREAQPDEAARMRKMAESYLDTGVAWEEDNPTLELDEMQLNQLRALGYQVP